MKQFFLGYLFSVDNSDVVKGPDRAVSLNSWGRPVLYRGSRPLSRWLTRDLVQSTAATTSKRTTFRRRGNSAAALVPPGSRGRENRLGPGLVADSKTVALLSTAGEKSKTNSGR
jgi:hypothetical protein